MITNETIIKAAKAAGLADMKPVAYLRWEDGVPLWSEDCVCKDDVYTNNGDDDSFGMPIYSAAFAASSNSSLSLMLSPLL